MAFDNKEHLIGLMRGKSVMPKLLAGSLERNTKADSELGKAVTQAIHAGRSIIAIDELGGITRQEK